MVRGTVKWKDLCASCLNTRLNFFNFNFLCSIKENTEPLDESLEVKRKTFDKIQGKT